MRRTLAYSSMGLLAASVLVSCSRRSDPGSSRPDADLATLLGEAVVEYSEGRTERAKQLTEQVIRAYPETPSGHLLLSMFAERPSERLLASTKGLEDHPDCHALYVQLIVARCQTLDFVGALRDIGLSSRLRRDDFWTAYTRPYVLYNLGAFKAAEEAMASFAESYPKEVWPRWNLAGHLRFTGRPQAALRVYDELVKSKPDSVPLRLDRARTLSAMGRNRDAIAELKRAVELYPESAAAHYLMAISFEDIGNLNAAEKHRSMASQLGLDVPGSGGHDTQSPEGIELDPGSDEPGGE